MIIATTSYQHSKMAYSRLRPKMTTTTTTTGDYPRKKLARGIATWTTHTAATIIKNTMTLEMLRDAGQRHQTHAQQLHLCKQSTSSWSAISCLVCYFVAL